MEAIIENQKEFKFKKGDSTTLQEFDDLFSELFNRTWVVQGKEFNLSDLGWKRDYNKRKKALGLCSYRGGRYGQINRRGTVFISMELLSRNLDKAYDFEDTIRHEIAHAIHAEIAGRSNHGAGWKAIARAVGADDTRTHEGFLEMPKGKYLAYCPNPKCDVERPYYRKPTAIGRKACGKCCKKYNNGRFDERFKFKLKEVA